MNFNAYEYEFTIFCNVTPCSFDRKTANYGPLRYDNLLSCKEVPMIQKKMLSAHSRF